MEVLHNNAYDSKLSEYVSNEKAAVSLISSIGYLMYEKSVELVLFRNPLVDQSISQVLNLHKKAKSIAFNPVDIFTTQK
ncbi:MAG TPA: glyceraldehyde-3-phosphate dehydrogenase, partial [Vicingus sp.]|nr:glyceraldehyde-3-phosphate dehydrogenase [Vicingus sp.]